jgi:hypothetical protein
MAGWFDGSASTADAGAFWDTTAKTAADDIGGGNINQLCDDFYVLRDDRVIWGGGADATQANIRIAYLTVWFGYKLTSADLTALVAVTNPRDIGGAADARYHWQLTTAAGGLADLINGITLSAQGSGSPTATFHDADNPSVNPPSGGASGGGPLTRGLVGSPLILSRLQA